MKSVFFDYPGPPKVLRIIETDIPKPNENQVLIKVKAAGVNRPDLLQREGIYPAPKGHSIILGLEVSGIIKKIGKKIKNLYLNDSVIALVDGGGYAEYCVVDQKQVCRKPKNITFIEAAGIPECFMTSWSNLVYRGKISQKKKVLIHGGTSGVGISAIQISKLFNSEIYTTVGNEKKKKICKELGVSEAINYKKEDFYKIIKEKTQKKGVNIILDMVGGDYVQKNIDLLSNDGKIINIAFQKGSKIELNLMKVMLKRLTVTGSTLRIRDSNFKQKILKDLNKFVFPKIEVGSIKIIVDSVFKLEDVELAHKKLYNNSHIGKVILSL